MTGETERSPSGWTIDTLAVHHDVIRQAEVRFQEERDRRYTEVKQAEEKALKIKEEADRTALGLQRDNQQYRDEKGNELRSQIEQERGTYITRTELKPIADYVAAQSGPRALTPAGVYAVLAAIGVLAALWFGSHRDSTSTTPAVVCSSSYHPAPCP